MREGVERILGDDVIGLRAMVLYGSRASRPMPITPMSSDEKREAVAPAVEELLDVLAGEPTDLGRCSIRRWRSAVSTSTVMEALDAANTGATATDADAGARHAVRARRSSSPATT